MASPDGSAISLWLCLCLSVVLLCTRVVLRRIKHQQFNPGDYWCITATVFITARLVSNYFLLKWGSTRTLSTEARLELLRPENAAEAADIIKGSKLILLTRTLLVCVLWALKMAVLDSMAKLISRMPYEQLIMIASQAAIAITFAASIVTNFVGCRPFERYWQIHPNPGDCVVGNLWLITYEASNIVTDAILMAVPLTLIISSKMPLLQRLRIAGLFSVGIFLIAVSIIRIQLGKGSRTQQGHTLWASLEVLFAVFVSVTPAIYALVRNRNEHDSTSKHFTHTTHRYSTNKFKSVNERNSVVWVELKEGSVGADNSSTVGILAKTEIELRRETVEDEKTPS